MLLQLQDFLNQYKILMQYIMNTQLTWNQSLTGWYTKMALLPETVEIQPGLSRLQQMVSMERCLSSLP